MWYIFIQLIQFIQERHTPWYLQYCNVGTSIQLIQVQDYHPACCMVSFACAISVAYARQTGARVTAHNHRENIDYVALHADRRRPRRARTGEGFNLEGRQVAGSAVTESSINLCRRLGFNPSGGRDVGHRLIGTDDNSPQQKVCLVTYQHLVCEMVYSIRTSAASTYSTSSPGKGGQTFPVLPMASTIRFFLESILGTYYPSAVVRGNPRRGTRGERLRATRCGNTTHARQAVPIPLTSNSHICVCKKVPSSLSTSYGFSFVTGGSRRITPVPQFRG